MTAGFEAALCQFVMTLRRCRDLNDIRLSPAQECIEVAIVAPHRVPVIKLPRHQRLTVTDPHDLTALDPQYLRSMRIRDLAAPDDGDFKHVVLRTCSFRNNS